jgi:uncharacterized protein
MPNDTFAPFQSLFTQLAPALEASDDGSHDASHLERVWRNAQLLAAREGGDLNLLAAAVILHDCVEVSKDSPLREQASKLSAAKAGSVLEELQWEPIKIAIVTNAILTHSYSAGLPPQTIEARILQDADRLDAIGMVGIARCFYTAGRMRSKLYRSADPRGKDHALDDGSYALDHFPIKLLRLSTGFQTETGKRMASERHARLLAFYELFLDELDA